MFRKINFTVTVENDSPEVNLQQKIQTQREWGLFIEKLKTEANKHGISLDNITCTLNGTNQGKHFKNLHVTGLNALDRVIMMEQDKKSGFGSKVSSLLMPMC